MLSHLVIHRTKSNNEFNYILNNGNRRNKCFTIRTRAIRILIVRVSLRASSFLICFRAVSFYQRSSKRDTLARIERIARYSFGNIVFANVPNCSIRDRVGSLAIPMEAFVASTLRAFSPLFAVSVPALMLFLSTRDRSLLSLLYCLRRPILFRPRRKPSCHTFLPQSPATSLDPLHAANPTTAETWNPRFRGKSCQTNRGGSSRLRRTYRSTKRASPFRFAPRFAPRSASRSTSNSTTYRGIELPRIFGETIDDTWDESGSRSTR